MLADAEVSELAATKFEGATNTSSQTKGLSDLTVGKASK